MHSFLCKPAETPKNSIESRDECISIFYSENRASPGNAPSHNVFREFSRIGKRMGHSEEGCRGKEKAEKCTRKCAWMHSSLCEPQSFIVPFCLRVFSFSKKHRSAKKHLNNAWIPCKKDMKLVFHDVKFLFPQSLHTCIPPGNPLSATRA